MSRDSSRWTYGRHQSVARVDGTPPKDGCRGEIRPTGGETAATETTTPAEGHKDTDGRRGGEESSGELQGNRNLEERGGWAGSDEGSAARRRADEVLARISALEVYFDRVEDQVVRTPPAHATAGAQVPERVTLSKGRSSDAAESNSCSNPTLGVGKRGEVEREWVGSRERLTFEKKKVPAHAVDHGVPASLPKYFVRLFCNVLSLPSKGLKQNV